MLSKNEWDLLESVVVGIADDARIPRIDKSVRLVNYADKTNEAEIPEPGLYPKQVIDEANEDLEKFCEFLRKQSIKVYRPDNNYKPDYYNYCPRDTVLVTENMILASPSPLRCRNPEYLAMGEIFSAYSEVIVAPRDFPDELYNEKCIGDPDTLALTEHCPAFDAANILRANDDLFYLVSNSGNEAGADYLQSLLPNKKVHKIKGVYSYMHLDSTIAFLREGLMLLNPSRIKSKDILPEVLQNWDVIWCPEPTDIGHYPGYCNASKWINMNLFSISTDLVALEENQHSLRKELEKYKIECAMLPMRHQRTLGGGFHCVTLDLKRRV